MGKRLLYRFTRGSAFVLAAAVLLAACGGAAPQAAGVIPQTGPTSISTETTAVSIQGSPAAQATGDQAAAACTAPAQLTPPLTEGPFFKAGSPEQTNLVSNGQDGTRLTLTGYVFTADCKPVAGALLDFWQANSEGQYDNTGYTLRGHQFTDSAGRYQLETIIPGLYPGRTEHIHVKVQAPGGPVLTTQLFFPGVTGNSSDQIFDQRLVISLQKGSSGEVGNFTFVIRTK